MYCKTNNKTTTWQVWRAHGEIAEDGQTRYSQEERKTDGWKSPIWEEHPWSLAFLNCLRIIRKSSSISSSGNIEVQTVRWIQEMCASMSLAFSSASHHTAVRLRLGLLKTGAVHSSLTTLPVGSVVVEDVLWRMATTCGIDAPLHGLKEPELA